MALWMIQFASAVFSDIFVCTLEYSVLAKKYVAQHLWIQYYVIFVLVFVLLHACLPATVLHDLLAEGEVSIVS